MSQRNNSRSAHDAGGLSPQAQQHHDGSRRYDQEPSQARRGSSAEAWPAPPEPAATDPNDQARRAALCADLIKLSAGWQPSAEDLAAAPRLEAWFFADYPDESRALALCGIVSGHPQLANGDITTSPLVAANFAAGWVRTHSRFYLLGMRLAAQIHDGDVA